MLLISAWMVLVCCHIIVVYQTTHSSASPSILVSVQIITASVWDNSGPVPYSIRAWYGGVAATQHFDPNSAFLAGNCGGSTGGVPNTQTNTTSK